MVAAAVLQVPLTSALAASRALHGSSSMAAPNVSALLGTAMRRRGGGAAWPYTAEEHTAAV